MKSPFVVGALGFLIAGTASVQAVTYAPIADTNAIVTGIRSDSSTSDSVVITSEYSVNGVINAGLYEGSLAAVTSAPSTSWHAFLPVIGQQTVTAASFYGPNTNLFDPSLGAGNITAVGSYKYLQGPSGPDLNHGVLYTGPIDGSGTWKQIDANPLVHIGETLKDTIAHSTMGDLVVGNYDTDLATGKAFIYNKSTDHWVDLNPGGSVSVTAYGIWQNGGSSSTSYTIAGGYSDVNSGGLDASYLVDYNSTTEQLTNYRTYQYMNQPGTALAHFDGITTAPNGFNLTGFFTQGASDHGFFANVPVNPDGSFGTATWGPISVQGASQTTGNTVLGNNVLGIFINGGTQSYLATVNPFSVALSVAKSGTRATFTITNTGDASGTFGLSQVRKIINSYTGPTPTPPGSSPVKIAFTLGGANVTKAVEARTAVTGTLAPGGTAKLVEKVSAKSRVVFQRTIHTTISATSTLSPSTSASAKVTLVLKPQP